jgi:hypothetical protein
MEVIEQVKALADIRLRKNMRIAFRDIERLFDEKAGRTVRVIRFLSIPAAMRHHNRMDLWSVVDTGLGIELLKVHAGIDMHFQSQTQGFNRMLVDANGNDEGIGSNPSQVRSAAKEGACVDKDFIWLYRDAGLVACGDLLERQSQREHEFYRRWPVRRRRLQ